MESGSPLSLTLFTYTMPCHFPTPAKSKWTVHERSWIYCEQFMNHSSLTAHNMFIIIVHNQFFSSWITNETMNYYELTLTASIDTVHNNSQYVHNQMFIKVPNMFILTLRNIMNPLVLNIIHERSWITNETMNYYELFLKLRTIMNSVCIPLDFGVS